MKYSSSIFSALIFLNIFLWYWVAVGAANPDLNLYFLKAGQGDSELIITPGGVKVLVDGGPGSESLRSLGAVLPPVSRYIDLVILSHPQLDHFGGLIDVFKRYKIGAFVWNGETGSDKSWHELIDLIESLRIPAVVVSRGDTINYAGSKLEILAPSRSSLPSNLNDDSLILRLTASGISALFTGDATGTLEQSLSSNSGIKSDILKVSHHGSKTSSIASFLSSVMPRLAVIEVGENNYGHPTPAALQRLAAVGASVYRTDRDGTVHLRVVDGRIIVTATE